MVIMGQSRIRIVSGSGRNNDTADDIMYRGRMGVNLADTARRFVSSTDTDKAIEFYDIRGTEAHILMLYKVGLISKDQVIEILDGLEGARVDGVNIRAIRESEDIHEALEREVTSRAGKESGGHLQTARSRNDQVVVATKMKLRHDTITIQTGILKLAETLMDLAIRHKTTIMPLYTHLQHAQTGTLSHYMLAHTDALVRDFGRFDDMYHRLDANPLGAGPVGGTSLPIDRDMTTRMLAFGSLAQNSLDATSSRDWISEFMSCVAIMMTNLSRMAEDIVLWSSSEFAFVELADAVSSPSSAMPQKKNPDVMELVRGKSSKVIGNLASALIVQKGLASGYGRDLQETKDVAFSSSDIAAGALVVMHQVMSGIKINDTRMAETAKQGHIEALDIAEILVRSGVPFRRAHMEVGALVASAHNAGKSLGDMETSEIKRSCRIDASIIQDAISQCLESQSGRSSVSPSDQDRMISLRHDIIKKCNERLAERRNTLDKAQSEMQKEIDALIYFSDFPPE